MPIYVNIARLTCTDKCLGTLVHRQWTILYGYRTIPRWIGSVTVYSNRVYMPRFGYIAVYGDGTSGFGNRIRRRKQSLKYWGISPPLPWSKSMSVQVQCIILVLYGRLYPFSGEGGAQICFVIIGFFLSFLLSLFLFSFFLLFFMGLRMGGRWLQHSKHPQHMTVLHHPESNLIHLHDKWWNPSKVRNYFGKILRSQLHIPCQSAT